VNDWIDDEDEDFLTAGFGAAAEADDSAEQTDLADQEHAEPALDEASWEPSAGFPDPSNSIRIWADEDGNLTKIRVSLSWREKLQGSLSDAFNVTLMYLNNWYRVARLDFSVDDGPAVHTTRQFSADALREVQQRIEQLDARLAQLPVEDEQKFDGASVSASDYDGAVKMTLDLHGYPSSVYIEQKWAEEEANASAISRSVMNCYRWARAKWRPPTQAVSERGQLRQEREQLSRELLAMMSNGIAS